LCGGICHTKVENSVSQGGGRIVLLGLHAIAVLQGWEGLEGRNIDGSLPKGMECGKVQVVGWVIAAHDPGFVILGKEASLVDDTNTNVHDVIICDGMLGVVGKRSSPEQVRNKEFKLLLRMPGHGGVVGFAIV
jgi:hypothetical protein